MHRIFSSSVSLCLCGFFSLVASSAIAAVPLAPAFKTADLDVPNCGSFVEGKATPADERMLISVLGLYEKAEHRNWTGFNKHTDTPTVVRYRVAFNKPVTVGSLLAAGRISEVALLKADAPHPGDPENAAHWQPLSLSGQQSGGKTITLDTPLATRAILLTDKAKHRSSQLEALRVWPGRLHNAAPASLAYAELEYYRPPADFSSPFTFHAANVTKGWAPWISAGKNKQGHNTAAPITDLQPTWFLLAWDREQPLKGLWLDCNLVQFEIDSFIGPPGVNPRAATAAEWKPLPSVSQLDHHGLWVEFPPVTTRGLRLRIQKTKEPQVAKIEGIHALVDLGDRPVPRDVAPTADPNAPAPKAIAVEMPEDGQITLAIDGPNGRRVRNAADRVAKTQGPHSISWDLKDERGQYVAPGKYRWKAIAHPPIELTYQHTAYPNISANAPENAPWLTNHHGPDGWLADHTPPVSVAAMGQHVYLGAQTAESGVSFISCDLTGRKEWGHHSFAAWTGPRYLAAASGKIFAGARMNGGGTDMIWSVDPETHAVKTFLALESSALNKRGMQGLAAHGNELAVSVRGEASWLAGAVAAEDVDLENCLPKYAPKRKVNQGTPPDPRNDFLRLFRLKGPPPGSSAGSNSLVYLRTERGSANAVHLVLAFEKTVPIGSIVLAAPITRELKDTRLKFSVLKPSASYPPKAGDPDAWTTLPEPTTHAWDVVPAPPGTMTRALRITYARGNAAAAGADDPLARLLDEPKGADVPADPLDVDNAGRKTAKTENFAGQWQGELEGIKLLRRRFENRAPQATVRVNSGKVTAGVWDAERTSPITDAAPGIYALEWPTAQPLRGLAIKEIDGQYAKIDVYEGPAGAIDISATSGWREVGFYTQARRDYYHPSDTYNYDARYMDGYVDFGEEVTTRAVRVRIVSQYGDKGDRGTFGVRKDLGGQEIDPARCRVYGVVPLTYIGGEAPVDSGVNERVEFYNLADGKPLHQVAVPKPGEIDYDAQGRLVAISNKQVVRVDREGKHETLITDLLSPTDLCFDKAGNLYVFDIAKERRQVRVYDASGKYLRSIGTAGGFRAGPWDPTRLGEVRGIDIDEQGQLWVVEAQYWPKRVTIWSTEGKLLKELLGNTQYGGGGVLDPADKTRVVFGNLEFKVDLEKGTSHLANMTWTGGTPAGELPIRVGQRTYFVTRPQFSDMPCGIVYLYEGGKLKLAAAAGRAADFDPLKNPSVLEKIGNQSLPERRFHWSDTNGDGEVQAEEVTLTPDKNPKSVTNFSPDLSVQAGQLRYKVKEILPNGAPVYVEEMYPKLEGNNFVRLADGNFYRMGSERYDEAVLSPDGEVLWTHQCEGNGVHSLYSCGPWHPGQVVGQFGVIGQFGAGTKLGEMLAFHGNAGGWNVWTADGLLIGPIFHDQRDGVARPWSMREHARGQVLENVTAGQEHFAGYVCQSEDGKIRVVAGHNHVSVLEATGLERAVRLGGEIDVTADDLRRAQAWEQEQQKAAVYARSPVLEAHLVKAAPLIDGDLGDWKLPAAARFTAGSESRSAEFRIAYDKQNLYLGYTVRGLGPLANRGVEFERLFKTGASVDLQIGADPAAAGDRASPVAGDTRLLMTFTGEGRGQPQAVAWRPVVAGTPEAKAFRVVSPVGEVTFDKVELLSNVQLAKKGDGEGYTVEAAVPLAALGLKPAPGVRLKLDWGVLVTGPDGNEVLRRLYWANQATSIVADAPSEARLHPNLWGHVLFQGEKKSTEDQLEEAIGKPKTSAADEFKDLLDK